MSHRHAQSLDASACLRPGGAPSDQPRQATDAAGRISDWTSAQPRRRLAQVIRQITEQSGDDGAQLRYSAWTLQFADAAMQARFDSWEAGGGAARKRVEFICWLLVILAAANLTFDLLTHVDSVDVIVAACVAGPAAALGVHLRRAGTARVERLVGVHYQRLVTAVAVVVVLLLLLSEAKSDRVLSMSTVTSVNCLVVVTLSFFSLRWVVMPAYAAFLLAAVNAAAALQAGGPYTAPSDAMLYYNGVMLAMLALVCGTGYTRELRSVRQFILAQHLHVQEQKTTALVASILPASVRDRYERDGPFVDEIPALSIMFVSVLDFDEVVGTFESPVALFEWLNAVYCEFDRVLPRELYKAEHINSDYVVATRAVVGDPAADHARDTAALVLHGHRLLDIAARFALPDGRPLQFKVGVNSGPAVAGIISNVRSFYRVFGDTINTAARMYLTSEPGCVHLSAASHALVRDSPLLQFEDRGVREVKGKGSMQTYFALRVADHAAGPAPLGRDRSARSIHEVSLMSGQIDRARERAASALPTRTFKHVSCKFRNSALEAAYSVAHRNRRKRVLYVFPPGFIVCYAANVLLEGALVEPVLIVSGVALAAAGGWAWSAKRAATGSEFQTALAATVVVLTAFLLALTVVLPTTLLYSGFVLVVLFVMFSGIGVVVALPALLCSYAGLAAFVATTDLQPLFGEENDSVLAYLGRLLVLAAFCFREVQLGAQRRRTEWHTERRVQRETDHTLGLLRAMIPLHVVRRLQARGDELVGESVDTVVLFSDICGFTPLGARLSPRQLVAVLREIYGVFDRLVAGAGLYKMDTIGDAFVVIGFIAADGNGSDGADQDAQRDEAASRVVSLALDMQAALAQYRERTGLNVQIRVGVHEGVSAAGVVGHLQPRFHVYGPTMLAAEALESACQPDRVHVSLAIARRLAAAPHGFVMEQRELETKTALARQELGTRSVTVTGCASPPARSQAQSLPPRFSGVDEDGVELPLPLERNSCPPVASRGAVSVDSGTAAAVAGAVSGMPAVSADGAPSVSAARSTRDILVQQMDVV